MSHQAGRIGPKGIFSWFCALFLSAPLLAQAQDTVLARVEPGGAPGQRLASYARLADAAGEEYLLVIDRPEHLAAAGVAWKPLANGVAPGDLLIATEFRPGARAAAAAEFTPLLDDGLRWVLIAGDRDAARLSDLGFEVERLGPDVPDFASWAEPRLEIARPGVPGGPRLGPGPSLVQQLVDRVQMTNLFSMLRQLTGEEVAIVGGQNILITTRNTTSGRPLSNATDLAFTRLSALGYQVAYSGWASGNYTNRNVVATRQGGARSNELVLVVGHLDNVPASGPAPGADDNATGSAAVLTAAGILSQCDFERSLRFILFTGEEQGLLGSKVYAAAAKAAGDKIVAVLNLDMLGWDGSGPPAFQLHTRRTTVPAHVDDFAIAGVFTNAVRAYGLSASLVPAIVADGITASDHSPFWNNGYPAICAIEDYGRDFTPYYHTINDTVATINFPYFTAAVKAAVATAAELAIPVGANQTDALEVAITDFRGGSDVGAGLFVARHASAALETGVDALDVPLTNAPAAPRPKRLEIFSTSDERELAGDARPLQSESPFVLSLRAIAPTSQTISGSNRLRFDFLSPPATDRVYSTRVRVQGAYITGGTDFLCVTNLRQVAAHGGYLSLPVLSGVPTETIYGSCEIAERFVDRSPEACALAWVGMNEATIDLATAVQAGVPTVDEILVTASILSPEWSSAATYTNSLTIRLEDFETGNRNVVRSIDRSGLPAGDRLFFKLKRTWL